MTLETDLLLDRRRLKRRLFAWRVATVVVVLLLVVTAIGGGVPGQGDYVARVSITGLMTSDRAAADALQSVLDDDKARALILKVDSPGGDVSVGERLHGLVALVAAKKPVVVTMGGVAASAGYMVSLPATRIFARESTLTGSIGVLLLTGEASGLLRTLGITDESMVSGPLKNQPSFTRPMSEQGRVVMQGIIDDLYDQFVQMVASGRAMPVERVRELADGRAYTGRQALKLGLIDAIGGETEARAWLASAKSIDAKLPMREIKTETWRDRMFGDGAEGFFGGLMKTLLSQRVSLDGAWAVWQPGMIRE
jgi:protease-4